MSRKDYIKLASAVYDNTSIEYTNAINKEKFIERLCAVLSIDNSLFDANKFKKYCYNGGKK